MKKETMVRCVTLKSSILNFSNVVLVLQMPVFFKQDYGAAVISKNEMKSWVSSISLKISRNVIQLEKAKNPT